MSKTALCINARSSSIKFHLIEAVQDQSSNVRWKGQIQGFGGGLPRLAARDATGREVVEQVFNADDVRDGAAAMPPLLRWVRERLGALPTAVCHRLTSGGARYSTPVLIDEEVIDALRELVPLMPLHLPLELGPIEVIYERFPRVSQVAVFDPQCRELLIAQDALALVRSSPQCRVPRTQTYEHWCL
ncbi:MAG: hypothetical protein GX547_06395 [Phycisphaerae bacterium]|nr:hypothetical protein [Phycisphaerae bacterium]